MIQKVKLTTREGKKVMGYRVTVTSDFHSNIENIWDKIQDVNTLREICKPKASFIACDDSPIQWKEGKTFVFKMYLHGFLPVGRHTINVVILHGYFSLPLRFAKVRQTYVWINDFLDGALRDETQK